MSHNSANEDLSVVLGHILVNGVVRESRQAVIMRYHHNFGLFRGGCVHHHIGNFFELHWYTPTRTLRKRAGAAPWPVPITWPGSPLPQFGVPHMIQYFWLAIASQAFQKSG